MNAQLSLSDAAPFYAAPSAGRPSFWRRLAAFVLWLRAAGHLAEVRVPGDDHV